MSVKDEFNKIIAAGIYPLFLLGIMWVVFILDNYLELNLADKYGLVPRTEHGLIGIITMPFIHGSYNHIISNSIPFLVSGWCIMYFYRPVALQVILLIYLGTGVCMWVVARPDIHIGASGLVYGFVSFVLFSGFLRRNRTLLAIAFMMVALYGGLVWYALPWAASLSISWEGHLCGAIIGYLCAYILRHNGPPDDGVHTDEDETPPDWWVQATVLA